MDFETEFDSRAAASRGIWLHIEHPSRKGEKLFADNDPAKPRRVLLLGREAPEAGVHYARIARARAKEAVAAKDAKATALPKTNEELHAELVELAKPLVLAFENVEFDGKPATKDHAERFLNMQLINGNEEQISFVEQVLRAAGDREEALGNASAI